MGLGLGLDRRAGLVVLQPGLPGPLTGGVGTDPGSEPRMATIFVRAFEVDLHDAIIAGHVGRRLEADADAVVEIAADRLGDDQRLVRRRGHIAAMGQRAGIAARGQPARDVREGVGGHIKAIARRPTPPRADTVQIAFAVRLIAPSIAVIIIRARPGITDFI